MSARADLCGGRSAMIVPTATVFRFDQLETCFALLASTEDHAWERSPDTGRLKASHLVQ